MKWARSHDTDLRFPGYKSETALTSFIDLFGNQRPASQRNPYRNYFLIILGHTGRADKVISPISLPPELTYCLKKPVCTKEDKPRLVT